MGSTSELGAVGIETSMTYLNTVARPVLIQHLPTHEWNECENRSQSILPPSKMNPVPVTSLVPDPDPLVSEEMPFGRTGLGVLSEKTRCVGEVR